MKTATASKMMPFEQKQHGLKKIPVVPSNRWSKFVNYENFLTLEEFSALDTDIQDDYLMFAHYLDINTTDKLAAYFKTSPQVASKVAAKHYFSEYDKITDEIKTTLSGVEKYSLGNYHGPITISVRRIIQKAQSSTKSGERLLDAISEVIRTYVAGIHKQSNRRGTYEFIDTMPNSDKPLLCMPEIEIKEENETMKKSTKKTNELYGMEKVVGKPYTDMDENDIEKAIAGCPIEPVYDEEKFLNDESYIRALFVYFPHIPTSLIAKCLFGKGCGCAIFTKIQKRISNLGINQQVVQKQDSLYEQAVFVGWAAHDPYNGMDFIQEYEEKHGKVSQKQVKPINTKKEKSGKPQKNTVAADKDVIIKKEDKEMPKKDTVTTTAKVEPKVKPVQPEKSQEVAHAIIVLDTTNPKFGKAIAMLYGEYADLILHFNQ